MLFASICVGVIFTTMAVKAVDTNAGEKISRAIKWIGDKTKERQATRKQKEEQKRLIRLKALSNLRKEVGKFKDDNSQRAKELREQYDCTLKCLYDDQGNERTESEIEKEIEKQPKKYQDFIKHSTNVDVEKDEVKKELVKFNRAPFTEEDTKITEDSIRKDLYKIHKQDEINKLVSDRNEKLDNTDSEDKKNKIKREYQKKIKEAEHFWDTKIGEKTDNDRKEKKQQKEEEPEEETVKDSEGVEWIKRRKKRGEGFTYCRKDDRSVTMSQREYRKRNTNKNESIKYTLKDFINESIVE